MMDIRTVELEDGTLYLSKDDLLEWIMAYSELEDLELEQIMILRELYDIIKLQTDYIEDAFNIGDYVDYDDFE